MTRKQKPCSSVNIYEKTKQKNKKKKQKKTKKKNINLL